MKAEICPDCGGSGQCECDERGNMYNHPVICECCNGSGARIVKDDGAFQDIYKG